MTSDDRHAYDNLLLLCSRHSKIVDSEPKDFTSAFLRRLKAKHERDGNIELSPADSRNAERLLADYRLIYLTATGDVFIHRPASIKAQNLTVNTERRTVKVLPPDGSIGADISKRNYVKHLIDRYNDFASKQSGRVFSFAAIYSQIRKRFGAKWDLIPVQCFEAVVDFLQLKVNRTQLGSINRGKGIQNYSDFSEFVQKYDHPH